MSRARCTARARTLTLRLFQRSRAPPRTTRQLAALAGRSRSFRIGRTRDLVPCDGAHRRPRYATRVGCSSCSCIVGGVALAGLRFVHGAQRAPDFERSRPVGSTVLRDVGQQGRWTSLLLQDCADRSRFAEWTHDVLPPRPSHQGRDGRPRVARLLHLPRAPLRRRAFPET